MSKKALLMILDGWGIGDQGKDDVIFNTPTPYWDSLLANYPHSELQASGENVGLPDGQMGNSEVGHLNIGAGRIVYQDLVKIYRACADNSIMKNPEIVSAFSYAKENGKNIHFMGLTSNGGVHSSFEHLFKLCDISKDYGIENTFIHCFMDGRDTDPKSGKGFIEELSAHCEKSAGKIASIIGRYYAMDRDNMWDRVGMAYRAMVNGEGVHNSNAVDAVKKSYETIDGDGKHLTDEFVMPTVCSEDGKIKENDSVVFFNFRPDRAREITRAFVDPEFKGFERKYFPLYYVCMTQYDETMPNVKVAFAPEALKNTMGEYLSSLGKTQLRIAETQKYAHVTFFFNGGEEKVYPGEDRVLIDSPKISTFDLKPEMSAYEVCDAACERILSGKYDVVILNYANCDMVGHTGVFPAAVKAVETVDECVGKLVDAVNKMGGVTLITADHGNADKMYAEDGTPFTAHTTNPVPLIVVGYDCKLKQNGGRLCDLAPTMLDIMGLAKPAEMTGVSLIEK